MKRILTGAVLIAVVFALIAFNLPWLIAAVSALLALLAALELRTLTAKANAPVPLWWMVLAIVLFFLNSATGWIDSLAVVATLTLILFTANTFRSPLERVLPETGAGLLLLLYVAYPLALIPRILAAEDGTALLLFLFLTVWCGDIAALYVGRNLGRRKLAPAISPNKTWEGSVASVFGSVAFGMALILLGDWFSRHNSPFTRLHTTWPWWSFVLLAVLLNVAAQIGDLAESALKRGVGVKDSGTLLPGHGGVLDRIDALLFAAPVLWLVLLLHAAL
jgi:phosphatidate cytidylyltransferase